MEKIILAEISMEVENENFVVNAKTLKALNTFSGKENVEKFKTELARIVWELINGSDD